MTIDARSKPLSLLLLLGCLLLVGPLQAEWDHKKVKGPDECAECHENEAEVWQGSKHHQGFRDFSQRKASKAIAKRMGVKHIKLSTAVCTQCHYTVGKRKRIVAGVSCESCHGPSADWLAVHNDYGGEDKDADSESPAHREQRYKKMHKLGMLRPDNLYGVASNCYTCHIVANEQLVMQGKHKAGSDFDLLDRMLPRDDREGNIYHGAKPLTAERKQALQITGYAVELEQSLRALGKTKAGSDYATKMQARARAAMKKLGELNAAAGSPEMRGLIKALKGVSIKPGVDLNATADRVAYHGRRYVASATGYQYGVAGKPPAAAKPKKTAKPAPTPAPKPAAASKPKAAAKPAARPKPSPTPAPRVREASLAPVAAPTLAKAGQLIADFAVIAPEQMLCSTRNPWMLGEQAVNNSTRLAGDGCVGLKARLEAEVDYFVFRLGQKGLVQLLPNSCQAMGRGSNRARQGEAVMLPLDDNRNPAVLALDGQAGVQRFYLVAMDDDRVRSAWVSELGAVAGPCDGAAAGKSWQAKNFEDLLKRFNQRYNGHLQWRVSSFSVE